MTRGLLDGITDPEIMARVAERRRVAERIAEQSGCSLDVARQTLRLWDELDPANCDGATVH